MPTGHDLTILGIAQLSLISIVDQAGVLGLTVVDTVLTKVVVVAVDLVHAGEFSAVLVVSVTAVLKVPTLLFGISYQSVAILEGGVDATEGSTGLAGIVGIHEGRKTEDLLVLLLQREGIQRVCSQECVVAQFTRVHNVEGLLVAPIRVCLGSELDALNHAERVSGCRINGLSLVDPVELHGQSIGRLIQHGGGQAEILVHDLEIRDVNHEIVVEVNDSSDLGQNADTLCQLQEEVPSCHALQVRTGKHVNELVETCGNRDLRHIDCEGVRSRHALVCTGCGVGEVVVRRRIGHVTQPCELTVAAGRLIEVERNFSVLVQVQSDGRTNACICG